MSVDFRSLLQVMSSSAMLLLILVFFFLLSTFLFRFVSMLSRRLDDLSGLLQLNGLKELSLDGNPVTLNANYVLNVVSSLPSLVLLDQNSISPSLKHEAECWSLRSKRPTSSLISGSHGQQCQPVKVAPLVTVLPRKTRRGSSASAAPKPHRNVAIVRPLSATGNRADGFPTQVIIVWQLLQCRINLKKKTFSYKINHQHPNNERSCSNWSKHKHFKEQQLSILSFFWPNLLSFCLQSHACFAPISSNTQHENHTNPFDKSHSRPCYVAPELRAPAVAMAPASTPTARSDRFSNLAYDRQLLKGMSAKLALLVGALLGWDLVATILILTWKLNRLVRGEVTNRMAQMMIRLPPYQLPLL